MTKGADPPYRGASQLSQDGLLHDWTTIWQSELNAAAVDHEHMQARAWMAAWWQAGAHAAAAWLRVELPSGPPPSKSPVGPPAADAAPDACDAAIARLLRRDDALERRLAELDRPCGT